MITINVGRTHSCGPLPSLPLERAAAHVLAGEGRRQAKIDIILLRDAEIRRINKKFLSHDYVTDVITFPIEDAPFLEGEIYIGAGIARRQAREYGVSFPEELIRLVVHGILHLCGFDDAGSAAAAMRRAEDAYVARFTRRSPGKKKSTNQGVKKWISFN